MSSNGIPFLRQLLLSTLLLSLTMSSSIAADQVIIEVNNTPTPSDDYICWSPVEARIRLVAPASAPQVVQLTSQGSTGSGAIEFQASGGQRPSRSTYLPQPTISVELPADGGWQNFWISGSIPSNGAKDILLTATLEGQQVASLPVMVRVRKDADTLSPLEIGQITRAFATLNGTVNGGEPGLDYYRFAVAHAQAFNAGIHHGDQGFPLFLAWHRAFLLDMERQLQRVVPEVALPYWRFDRPSSNVFVGSFMGTVGTLDAVGGSAVMFDPDNPLARWRMPQSGQLVRGSDVGGTADDVLPLTSLFMRPGVSSYDSPGPRGFNGDAELRYHNSAHNAVQGWLASGASPRDPLFFLLHANVDRAWAEWQANFDRFDSTSLDAYSHGGSYPGPTDNNRRPKGSYALDEMWPWGGGTGVETSDRLDDWPAVNFSFPAGPAGAGPEGVPTPASMIDYMDVNGDGAPHMSCYDDIDFFGRIGGGT